MLAPILARGQATVSDDAGLRFPRFAGKDPRTLAQKAGGPTERIETIVTPDNVDFVTQTFRMTRGNASDIFPIIQFYSLRVKQQLIP